VSAMDGANQIFEQFSTNHYSIRSTSLSTTPTILFDEVSIPDRRVQSESAYVCLTHFRFRNRLPILTMHVA
jgi:hypothetical protein